MEIVAVHLGVIDTKFSRLSGLMKKVSSAILLTPEQGAQASILTASLRSVEIYQDRTLPYYHNKHGWLALKDNDMALNEDVARSLFDQFDEICGTCTGYIFTSLG